MKERKMTISIVGETLPRSKLSDHDIQTMFNLFLDYYEATFETFQRDLCTKDWIILLRDIESGSIQGFSTLAFYTSIVNGGEIGVVYSGDTIIRPAYWGTPELPRTWIKTVLEIGKELPKPLYWLLISSGYKTYRFLTLFYKQFYPRYDQPTPPEIQAIIHHLASERFGPDYYPQLGVVRFTTGSTSLREGVAEITERRLKDPHVAFFVQKNPGHTEGEELVCLTNIHQENFTPAGKRMIR
jgi:hypothetical protein